MKAARRQELRTNDLSQQLDKLGESFKRNSTAMTAVIVGAIVIVMGIYWYSNSRAATVDQSVAQLSYDSSKEDIRTFIDRCKSVANQNVNADVTRMAWLRMGSAAMSELTKSQKPTDENAKAPTMTREELTAAARDAFGRVESIAGNDPNLKAAAGFALGLLDENAGDFNAARNRYNGIKGDTRLANTPFIKQAEFRLAQLDNWAKPVVFAEPPILPPAPDPTEISATPEATPVNLTPAAVAPKSVTIEQLPDFESMIPASTPPADQTNDTSAAPAEAAPTPASAPAP
ncbi:MAG: hypothetical protein IPK83_01050 [Planctomycetes bacterium]|nr:hypothetical protein [Planctomycetota bacterium]